ILTPQPKHWSAREKRTARRPRLAALSLRHAAWNVIARLLMFVAAASRDGSRSGGSVKMRPPLRGLSSRLRRAVKALLDRAGAVVNKQIRGGVVGQRHPVEEVA